MSGDLVKRLRDARSPYECTPIANLIHEAADRIEELEAKLAEAEGLFNHNVVAFAKLQDDYEALREKLEVSERDIKIAFGNTNAAIEDYNDAIAQVAKLRELFTEAQNRQGLAEIQVTKLRESWN